jgi:hypothetical protein
MAKRKKITHKDIAKRITGFSLGPFGVSWTPRPDKREIIRQLIVFLEDRRVLYNPYDMEYGKWVNQSILEVRKELTDTLKKFPDDEPTIQILRTMRSSCRKYLQECDTTKPRIYGFQYEMKLAIHLGELRGVFGLALAQLCIAYKIDVEPELASIFPVSDKDSKDNKTVKR